MCDPTVTLQSLTVVLKGENEFIILFLEDVGRFPSNASKLKLRTSRRDDFAHLMSIQFTLLIPCLCKLNYVHGVPYLTML